MWLGYASCGICTGRERERERSARTVEKSTALRNITRDIHKFESAIDRQSATCGYSHALPPEGPKSMPAQLRRRDQSDFNANAGNELQAEICRLQDRLRLLPAWGPWSHSSDARALAARIAAHDGLCRARHARRDRLRGASGVAGVCPGDCKD